MPVYHRGQVLEVFYPDGKGGLKTRPVVVLHTTQKKGDAISVYCTTQNDGDDDNCIFVEFESTEGKEMGLKKDTYIRPKVIKTIDAKFVVRPMGKCPYMQKIQQIIDKNMGM